jgi:hypothetical protein
MKIGSVPGGPCIKASLLFIAVTNPPYCESSRLRVEEKDVVRLGSRSEVEELTRHNLSVLRKDRYSYKKVASKHFLVEDL